MAGPPGRWAYGPSSHRTHSVEHRDAFAILRSQEQLRGGLASEGSERSDRVAWPFQTGPLSTIVDEPRLLYQRSRDTETAFRSNHPPHIAHFCRPDHPLFDIEVRPSASPDRRCTIRLHKTVATGRCQPLTLHTLHAPSRSEFGDMHRPQRWSYEHEGILVKVPQGGLGPENILACRANHRLLRGGCLNRAWSGESNLPLPQGDPDDVCRSPVPPIRASTQAIGDDLQAIRTHFTAVYVISPFRVNPRELRGGDCITIIDL